MFLTRTNMTFSGKVNLHQRNEFTNDTKLGRSLNDCILYKMKCGWYVINTTKLNKNILKELNEKT